MHLGLGLRFAGAPDNRANFIEVNIASLLILLAVLIAVAAALYSIHKRKKKTGSCLGCPLNDKCNRTGL